MITENALDHFAEYINVDLVNLCSIEEIRGG